jgi:hypothetical protein
VSDRRSFRPGEWGEDRYQRRRDRGYPVGPIREPEPVAPHTPYGRSVCNAFCVGKDGCHNTVALVRGVGKSLWLEPRPSPAGAFVLEMDEFLKPIAVPFDAAIHDGWLRYAEHACPLKGTAR